MYGCAKPESAKLRFDVVTLESHRCRANVTADVCRSNEQGHKNCTDWASVAVGEDRQSHKKCTKGRGRHGKPSICLQSAAFFVDPVSALRYIECNASRASDNFCDLAFEAGRATIAGISGPSRTRTFFVTLPGACGRPAAARTNSVTFADKGLRTITVTLGHGPAADPLKTRIRTTLVTLPTGCSTPGTSPVQFL